MESTVSEVMEFHFPYNLFNETTDDILPTNYIYIISVPPFGVSVKLKYSYKLL